MPIFEMLEQRRLMSHVAANFQDAIALVEPGNPVIVHGQLEIVGSSLADHISVTRETSLIFDNVAAVPLTDGTMLNIIRTQVVNREGPTPLDFATAIPKLSPNSAPLAAGPYIRVNTGLGRNFYYLASQVTSIRIDGAAGNDDIIVGKNIHLPARIDGGKGNDTLQGSSASDTLIGGDGNDMLIGGPSASAANILCAGVGHDTIVSANNDDMINTSDGDDILITAAGAVEKLKHGISPESVSDVLASL
jgi:hypothetical protein